MPSDEQQQRIEFAVERLLGRNGGWRTLVRDLAAHWPCVEPLDLVMTLTEAADAIEQYFSPGNDGQAGATNGYRLAVLLSLDLHAMERLGMRAAAASDLSAYWIIDDYFLKL